MKYLAIASTAVAAMPAFAQSKNFEGSNLSLGIGSIQLKESSDSISKNWNTGGNIEFTNFKSLNDSWLLGFGVGYDVGSLDSNLSGSTTSSIVLEDDPYSYRSQSQKQIKLKNNFSLSLLPAFALNKSSMLYGRISYNRAKVSSSGSLGSVGDIVWTGTDDVLASNVTCADAGVCDQITGGQAGSKYVNGIGWGFGLRHKFTENLFLQAEYKYVSYKHNSELDVKPKTQGYTLSVGYKF